MDTDDLSRVVREQFHILLQEMKSQQAAEPQPDIQAAIALELQRQQQRKQAEPVKKPLGLVWKVASVFPMPRKLPKPQHVHRKLFELPAVPKGSVPSIIEIRDEEEYRYAGFGRNTAGIVPAIDIAEDFVFYTTNFIVGRRNNGSPGVWIVGTLGDGRMTLEEETQIMLQRQASFFQEWLDDAREHAAKHEFTDITNMHRLAAEYLGITGDRRETWQLQEYTQQDEKCRYCQEFISKEAVKCPKCGGIAKPEQYARMQREERELIEAMSAPLTRKAKTQQQEAVNV